MAHFIADRYREALKFAELAWREQPEILYPKVYCCSKRSVGRTNGNGAESNGRFASARSQLTTVEPPKSATFHRAEAYAKWEEGMRLAGLPE